MPRKFRKLMVFNRVIDENVSLELIVYWNKPLNVWELSILYVSDADEKRWYKWKTMQTWTIKPSLSPIQTEL